MRLRRQTRACCLLLLVGLLSLAGCRPSCTSYRPVRDRLVAELAALPGGQPVDVLVPTGAERCFSELQVTAVPAPVEAFEILTYLEDYRPRYVMAGDGLNWDEIRAQPWFLERFRQLDRWPGVDPEHGARTLHTYVPSSFDLGELVTTTQRFATDAVILRSFRISCTHVEPNVPLYLSLFWDDLPGGDYRDLMALLDLVEERSGKVWSAVEDTIEPTAIAWRPEYRLARRYLIVPPDELPEGAYVLRLRLVERSGRPVAVGVGGAAEMVLAALTHPPDVSSSPPATQHHAEYRFGGAAGAVDLRGYDAPSWVLQGSELRLVLVWGAVETPVADLHVFVHLVNGDGDVVAQADGVPVYGFYPTSSWSSGDVIRDVYTLGVPGELPPGDYVLVVGLYDPASGARVPVTGGQGTSLPMDQVRLHTLTLYPAL